MKKIIAGILVAGIVGSTLTACESWERQKKDMESEYGGGLKRTVEVYNYGKLIKTYEGKFDVEKKNGRIKFIDQNKKVHIIYLGDGTTVAVDEQ